MKAGKAASLTPCQADLGGQIVAEAGPRVQELAAQIGEAQFVHQVGPEDVRVRAQHALHADVGEIARGIGRRDAVGAGVVGAAVVDVVARGEQVGGAELVIQACRPRCRD